MGIDLGLHHDEVPVTTKLVEKCAEVGERHGWPVPGLRSAVHGGNED
jgi:hypothetical protein